MWGGGGVFARLGWANTEMGFPLVGVLGGLLGAGGREGAARGSWGLLRALEAGRLVGVPAPRAGRPRWRYTPPGFRGAAFCSAPPLGWASSGAHTTQPETGMGETALDGAGGWRGNQASVRRPPPALRPIQGGLSLSRIPALFKLTNAQGGQVRIWSVMTLGCSP